MSRFFNSDSFLWICSCVLILQKLLTNINHEMRTLCDAFTKFWKKPLIWIFQLKCESESVKVNELYVFQRYQTCDYTITHENFFLINLTKCKISSFDLSLVNQFWINKKLTCLQGPRGPLFQIHNWEKSSFFNTLTKIRDRGHPPSAK